MVSAPRLPKLHSLQQSDGKHQYERMVHNILSIGTEQISKREHKFMYLLGVGRSLAHFTGESKFNR